MLWKEPSVIIPTRFMTLGDESSADGAPPLSEARRNRLRRLFRQKNAGLYARQHAASRRTNVLGRE